MFLSVASGFESRANSFVWIINRDCLSKESSPPSGKLPALRPALKKLCPVFRFLGRSRMVKWTSLIVSGLILAHFFRLLLFLL
jgi:hypothetical protein